MLTSIHKMSLRRELSILKDISIFTATWYSWCVYTKALSIARQEGEGGGEGFQWVRQSGPIKYMDLFGPFYGPSLACKILGANCDDETLLFATYVVVIKLLILFISCALETKGSRLLKMF